MPSALVAFLERAISPGEAGLHARHRKEACIDDENLGAAVGVVAEPEHQPRSPASAQQLPCCLNLIWPIGYAMKAE